MLSLDDRLLSEDSFRTLIQNLHACVIVLGPKAEIQFANQAALDAFGMAREQVLGKTGEELQLIAVQEDGSEYPLSKRPGARAIKSQRSIRNEIWGLRRGDSNEVVWLYGAAVPESASRGSPGRVIITATDITEHRKSLAALQRANELNRQILLSAQEGIVVHDRQLRYVLWNPVMERMSGMKEKDVLGKHPLDLFPFLAGWGFYARLEMALKGKVTSLLDVPFTIPQTQRHGWCNNNFAPLRDENGEIVGVVGTVTDVTEHKRREQQLRESEAFLAQAEELANMGSWEHDVEKRTLNWSAHFYRMLGLEPHTGSVPEGRDIAMIHPDDREQAIRDAKEMCIRGRPFDNVLRFVTANGDERVFHSRAVALTDRAGRVVRIRGMSQDVTERKNREDELWENQSLLAHAEELANMGSWELDVEKQTMKWSAHFYRMLGLEPETAPVSHARALEVVHPDDREQAMRTGDEMLSRGASADNVLRFVTANGDVRLFHSRAIAITDGAGRVVRVRGMSQDITERKREEERLRRSEAVLSQAEQLTNSGSWESDLRTGKSSLSKHLLQMYGLASEADWDRDVFWQRVYPADRERARGIIDRATADCKPFEYTLRYRAPDGTFRVHSVRAIQIPGADGRAERSIGVAQDITNQTRVEEDLRRLSQELLRARDDERRNVARTLHDSAGQSLVALKMVLGGLREGLPGKGDRSHELLESAIELAGGAIREVRTLSYLMHPPLLDEVGLALALQWYAKGFAERSGIEVSVDVPENFGRHSQEIETTLFRVVQEALTNAHRYSGSRTAKIRLAIENGQIRTEVQDRGRGMQTSRPVENLPAPLGVGIAGMRERIKQLNGVFEIESVPGQGTTVRAILPLTPPGPLEKIADLDRLNGTGQKSLRKAARAGQSGARRAGSSKDARS
ncbi:MAG: PAS domain S-box protein [Candidatus Acidiferrales bacterium]